MGIYRAVAQGLTVPANPTDLVTISGSATKITKVLAIELLTLQTNLGLNTWSVIKRSSANSYSTGPTTMPAVPYDSLDLAADAIAGFATVAPTALGTTVGQMAIASTCAPSFTSVVEDANYVFDFSKNPIFLRGTSELLALNFQSGAKPAGLTVGVAVIFSEE